MNIETLPVPSETLFADMQGVWWLQTREDRTKDGQQRIDPVLGSDPVGILSYAKNHFAAQFMKRNRMGNNFNPVIMQDKIIQLLLAVMMPISEHTK
jgi:hypothetical protein